MLLYSRINNTNTSFILPFILSCIIIMILVTNIVWSKERTSQEIDKEITVKLLKDTKKALDSGSYLKTLKFTDLIINLQPNNIEAHWLKGLALMKLKRYKDSIREFKIVSEIQPNNQKISHFIKKVQSLITKNNSSNIIPDEIHISNHISKYLIDTDEIVLFNGLPDKNWSKYDYIVWGIISQSLIWLDKFTDGFEAKLNFELNQEKAKDITLAITAAKGPGINHPIVRLNIQKLSNNEVKYVMDINYKLKEEITVKGNIPKNIKIVLKADGIKFNIDGFPNQLFKWSNFKEFQSLRLAVYTKYDKEIKDLNPGISKITLTRRAGKAEVTMPKDGVFFLPKYVLYSGEVKGLWKKTDTLKNAISSTKPILNFNERIEKTSYKLKFKITPDTFSNVKILFTKNEVPNIKKYNNGFIQLSKLSNGDYQLSLHKNDSNVYYKYVPSRVIDKHWIGNSWNGILEIEVDKDSMVVGLEGDSHIRDIGYHLGKGTKLYMTIVTGDQRSNIEKITAQWMTPDDMSNSERWMYLNDDTFNPNSFLNDLIEGEL